MAKRTDKDLAQIALGAVRLTGGDPKETKRTLYRLGLTDAEINRALAYLQSDQPMVGR
ncbi:hypothetical protein [Streptomyces sp. WAC01280]|uniref:hypothetical protein n=1 Tax=Streptomyces sp. WAC01280 TaxID=2487424 RepID=UPI00163C52CE|nr:hypothetical protein [Streptomyces sp. WAC01280]